MSININKNKTRYTNILLFQQKENLTKKNVGTATRNCTRCFFDSITENSSLTETQNSNSYLEVLMDEDSIKNVRFRYFALEDSTFFCHMSQKHIFLLWHSGIIFNDHDYRPIQLNFEVANLIKIDKLSNKINVEYFGIK